MADCLSVIFKGIQMRWISLSCLVFCAVDSVSAKDKPDILLIMADDIGVEGLGCYGGMSYRTPHLDRMAAEGLRFRTAYSQPLCTPTRVQIMTGLYNNRNWKYFGILDPSATTFGHQMKAAGYATGIFGKWQLQSYDPPDLPNAADRRGTGMHPKDAGFDEYALFHSLHTEDKGSRFANPTMLQGAAGSPGELRNYAGRYGEDVWVEKIVDFFDDHRNEPTFVYYPMALPHRPFEPTPNTRGWDPKDIPEEDVKFITDMVEYMDTTVGSLMAGLQSRGLRENTLVLFYADNGFHRKVFSELKDGRTIQGGKGEPLQTGIHVPLIASWPGHIQPGVCDDIVDASDFLPTLLEIGGSALSVNDVTDGVSFAPQLFGRAGRTRESAFFWYDPRPGWDKERFHRSVFAVNRNYKRFRDGRLFRLTDRPLEEIPVNLLHMTPEDQSADKKLATVIDHMMSASEEPPLVDAHGKVEHDFFLVPADRKETDQINAELLATGHQFSYGDSDIEEQRLWIFPPLAVQPGELRPCVFFIHGGGWGGNPAGLAAQSVYLQRRGYATVSIHFRPPKGDLTPKDTLRDARKAWRWIIEHGREHHIDPDRIVVSGGSAGGHLSLALSTISLEDDPVVENLPKGYVLFNPVIDLVDGWTGGRKKCETAGITPLSFSPAHHVRAGLPPTLILSGSDDGLIPPSLIHAFQKRMKQVGSECDFIEYPGAGHGFFNYGREDNRYFRLTMQAFENFLAELKL